MQPVAERREVVVAGIGPDLETNRARRRRWGSPGDTPAHRARCLRQGAGPRRPRPRSLGLGCRIDARERAGRRVPSRDFEQEARDPQGRIREDNFECVRCCRRDLPGQSLDRDRSRADRIGRAEVAAAAAGGFVDDRPIGALWRSDGGRQERQNAGCAERKGCGSSDSRDAIPDPASRAQSAFTFARPSVSSSVPNQTEPVDSS